MFRKLTKDYFNRHPVKELSAARFRYSLLLSPAAEEKIFALIRESEDLKPYILDDSKNLRQVEEEQDLSKMLRMLRKKLSPEASHLLCKKILLREEEAMPQLKSLLLRTFTDHCIEKLVEIFTFSKENCSDWILENYSRIFDPYAKSMICLVLGFRADESVVPFLMEQVEAFEQQYPNESFEQAPLIALTELQARYR